jgi:hypothetical protein
LLVELLSLNSEIIVDLSTTDVITILPLVLLDLTLDGIGDQPVKTLQEGGSKMLVKEVNIPEAKDLLAILVVPAAHTVQVVGSAHRLGDIS